MQIILEGERVEVNLSKFHLKERKKRCKEKIYQNSRKELKPSLVSPLKNVIVGVQELVNTSIRLNL